jgi:hypothetical protein
MLTTKEYQEGERASEEGKTTRHNPYRFGSEQHWRWQEGLLGNGKPRDESNKPRYL